MTEPDELALDYLLVADAADAVGGKLYLLGGGWDRLLVPQLPGPPGAPFAVAVGLSVPWGMTNKKLHFGIDVLDADGQQIAQLADLFRRAERTPGRPMTSLAGPDDQSRRQAAADG